MAIQGLVCPVCGGDMVDEGQWRPGVTSWKGEEIPEQRVVNCVNGCDIPAGWHPPGYQRLD